MVEENKEKETKYYIEKFYTLEKLSKTLNINIQTLRAYIRNKELKAYKKGGKWILLTEDIETWLKDNNKEKKEDKLKNWF